MSNYTINNLEDYKRIYNESVDQSEVFWNDLAKDNFKWQKKWDSVIDWDFQKPEIKWFEGGKLNITENCLDRHLINNPNKTAIIFEPNDPSESSEHISYENLYHPVNKMANVLKDKGVKKGDRVCIYLPMIPELAISVLACAKVGAVHSVVFAGFSSNALATRINDCQCKIVLTSDGSFRGNKILDLNVDEKSVWVEPGVVLDHLNAYLKPYGLWFPVDVSTSSRATIGGMSANNSCGSRSLYYGNMVHNVLAIETILDDGSIHTLSLIHI